MKKNKNKTKQRYSCDDMEIPSLLLFLVWWDIIAKFCPNIVNASLGFFFKFFKFMFIIMWKYFLPILCLFPTLSGCTPLFDKKNYSEFLIIIIIIMCV